VGKTEPVAYIEKKERGKEKILSPPVWKGEKDSSPMKELGGKERKEGT